MKVSNASSDSNTVSSPCYVNENVLLTWTSPVCSRHWPQHVMIRSTENRLTNNAGNANPLKMEYHDCARMSFSPIVRDIFLHEYWNIVSKWWHHLSQNCSSFLAPQQNSPLNYWLDYNVTYLDKATLPSIKTEWKLKSETTILDYHRNVSALYHYSAMDKPLIKNAPQLEKRCLSRKSHRLLSLGITFLYCRGGNARPLLNMWLTSVVMKSLMKQIAQSMNWYVWS
jgi:hypothetical protein